MRPGDQDCGGVTYVDLRNASIAKSVESVRCSDPDIAFSIFEDDLGLAARKTVSKKELILFGLSISLLRQGCDGTRRYAIESTTGCKPKCVGAIKTDVVYIL
jgi:hypothetical protein